MKKYFKLILVIGIILSCTVVYNLQGTLAVSQPYLKTPNDNIPNFAKNPTITSAQNGFWSDPNTWAPARLPGAGDVILINHSVTYGNTFGEAMTIGIDVGGTLKFKNDQNTKLKVGTLLVMPGGTLEVGTEQNPIQSQVTAEIIIADQALDLSDDGVGVFDPEQFGTGLLVIDGAIIMHGTAMTPTFIRLAKEPKAGDSTLILEKVVSGWEAGDRLVLPDTRHIKNSNLQKNFSPQWEELTIQSISGTTITLSTPLAFDHLGARDGDGKLDFLPHVANLRRNIIVRSENPVGMRGHTIFANRADVDIRYVLFRDLGRTKIGTTPNMRFAFHIHHLYGPKSPQANGNQFTIIGNALDGGTKDNPYTWGITVHDSHYGLISQNVVYNISGTGIGTVDASESRNVFEKNFVMRVMGNGGRTKMGDQGTAFWFKGVNNFVRDNVAANAWGPDGNNHFGYSFYLANKSAGPMGKTIRIPKFQGANTSVEGEYTEMSPHVTYVLEFARNEVYGATMGGMTYWFIGAAGRNNPKATKYSVIKDLMVWHVNKGFVHYPTSKVIIDGFVMRGKITDGGSGLRSLTGWDGGDYWAHDWVIRNADIQGMKIGIIPSADPGNAQIIEDSYLRNSSNIFVRTMHTSAPDARRIGARETIIRNVKFVKPSVQFSGLTPYAIEMLYSSSPTRTLIQKDEVFVENYNGISGDNFQVFYEEQQPDFIVPKTVTEDGEVKVHGSPESGLTNLQNRAKYGIAIAGAVALCTDNTTRPEIKGFTCPTAPPPPPDETQPTIPQNLEAIAASPSQIDLNWQASTDPESGIVMYNVYRDGMVIGQPVTASFSDTGLNESTNYTYEVSAVNGAGLVSGKSVSVSVTTLADITPPKITSVNANGTPTEVTLVFDEPIEQASGEETSNYQINNGITVLGAALSSDQKTVSLTTSPHSEEITYNLIVNNVKDRASTPNVIASNTQVSYTFVAQLISNLTVVSSEKYEIVKDSLKNGDIAYIDRSFTYSSVPSFLEGETYIKTANDDKGSTGASFLTFDANQDVTVYVAHDDRITAKPEWMDSFTDTGDDLVVNATLSLFSKDFSEGKITIGGNEGDGTNMYTVVIVRRGPSSVVIDTIPPSAPTGLKVIQ